MELTEITTGAQAACNNIFNSINWLAFAITIIGGLVAKYRFPNWNLSNAWKTLIVSTICITLWVVICMYSGTYHRVDAPGYLLGYLVAIAVYPLIVKPLVTIIKSVANFHNKK